MATYTRAAITSALRRAGFPASSIPTWTAIVLAESSGRSDATNDTRNIDPEVLAARGHSAEYSLGPFQINMIAHAGSISEADARDLDKAAAFAFELSGGGKNMSPWGSFTDGRYRQFVGADSGTGGSKNLARPVDPGSNPTSEGDDSIEAILRRLLGASGPSTPKLRVPGNLVGVLEAESAASGVPVHIIAGVIQAEGTTGTSGDWPVGITPKLIAEITADLAAAGNRRAGENGYVTSRAWRDVARAEFGQGSKWLERFDSIVYATGKDGKADFEKPQWIQREPSVLAPDATKITVPKIGKRGGYVINLKPKDSSLSRADLSEAARKGLISPAKYEQALREMGYSDEEIGLIITIDAPEQARTVDLEDVREYADKLLGREMADTEAQQYVGRTPAALRAALIATPEAAEWRKHGTKIQAARQWATSIYRSYLGKDPTNAELKTVIDNGWTADALTSWLRARPYGTSTLGKKADVKAEAQKYAREYLGRDADAGEIDWILANTPGNASHIDAYYEQLKTRVDSGDPSFAWAADPETWRSTQRQVQSIWTQAGLTGVIDPRLVNKAAAEKWTARDIATHVDGLPAPGFQQGITVGEVARVSKIAGSWKEHYLPGTPLTKEEMFRFVQMGSDDIRLYYRSLPAEMGRKARLGNPSSEVEEDVVEMVGPDKKTYESKPSAPGRTYAGGSPDGKTTFWTDEAGKIHTEQSDTSRLPTEVMR